jgi:hypothetical protein
VCPPACARPRVPARVCPPACARPRVPARVCPPACARPRVPARECPPACARPRVRESKPYAVDWQNRYPGRGGAKIKSDSDRRISGNPFRPTMP